VQKRKLRRHRRGEGTVYYDRSARRWAAVLRLGTDPKTGKRRTVKATAGTQHDADVLLARLQRQYGRGGDVALMTLDAYLAEWLDAVNPTHAPTTMLVYRHHVEDHIGPLLGGIRVGSLHQRDVRRLIEDRLRAGLSAATVGHIVATLRNALGQAVSDGDLVVNVAQVELPRVERPAIEAMTPETAQAILEAVRDDRLQGLWVLLLGTGLRLGEACALDWRDIDLEAPSVFVRKGKTASATRRIPLPAFVVTALRQHRAAAKRIGPREPVFVGERTHDRLSVGVASHALPRLLVSKGLPRLTPHKLRHGTATLLHQQGVPMRDIADILGHSSPTITARTYAHVSEGAKREAMGRLDAVAERREAPG
jgi:integrase